MTESEAATQPSDAINGLASTDNASRETKSTTSSISSKSTDNDNFADNSTSNITIVSSDLLKNSSQPLESIESPGSGPMATPIVPVVSSSDSQPTSNSSSQTSSSAHYADMVYSNAHYDQAQYSQHAHRSMQSHMPQFNPAQSLSDSTTFTISVTNLPFIVRWQELKDLVKEIVSLHQIARVEVFTMDSVSKKSQGIGSIVLRGKEAAMKCIQYLDGYEWHSRTLTAKLLPPIFVPFAPTQSLPYAPTMFSIPGRMSTTPNATPLPQYAIPPMMGIPVPPVYPEYQSSTTASSPSISSGPDYFPPPHNYNHRHNHHQPPITQPPDVRKVFIGNIPFSTEKRAIQELIQTAGTLDRIDIINNNEGQSRGFAIAVFGSEDDASRAIQMFDGAEFEGRILAVRLDRYPDSRGSYTGNLNAGSSSHSSNGKNFAYGNGYKKFHKKEGFYYNSNGGAYASMPPSQYNYSSPFDPASTYWNPDAFQTMKNQFQGMQLLPQFGYSQIPPQVHAQLQAQAAMQSQAQMTHLTQYQMVPPMMPPQQFQSITPSPVPSEQQMSQQLQSPTRQQVRQQ
ncbi:hypothetical protein V1512DRAFT_256628 [Lipomyces arxii]|uniref:uncharacterized protein n=1 Tax=Lipomyces arxii TaxID=56418 RepID=UPI0034CF1E7B